MSIREKRTSISQFAAALRQRSSQDKRDLLVADTLDSLCRHCDLYDAARVSSNPFHPELLRAIAAADFSPDALFSLFECLAVLVHLRKLAHPAIPLDDAEEELLFQFEHSGEWLSSWAVSPLSSSSPPPPAETTRPGGFFVAARTVHAGGRHEKSPPKRAFFTGLQPFRYRTRPIR